MAMSAQSVLAATPEPPLAGTPPVANDSGTLIHGNIQIHPALAKSIDETCPPPSGMCMPIH